ncbi:MAG: CopG family ribbon-helix-helix protein [Planctomycetia bacterium]
MRTISVKLPEPLATWLDRAASERSRSRSEIIREALERWQAAARAGDGPSVAEVLGDLRGSVSGPRDLSTNPKHLRGYGA